MFPLLALAHRHLKLIHCLLRAAVLTSTDEFQWQGKLIEFLFFPFLSLFLLPTTVLLLYACFTARESVLLSEQAKVIFITAEVSGSQSAK